MFEESLWPWTLVFKNKKIEVLHQISREKEIKMMWSKIMLAVIMGTGTLFSIFKAKQEYDSENYQEFYGLLGSLISGMLGVILEFLVHLIPYLKYLRSFPIIMGISFSIIIHSFSANHGFLLNPGVTTAFTLGFFYSSLYSYNWILSSTFFAISQILATCYVSFQIPEIFEGIKQISPIFNFNSYVFLMPFFFFLWEKLKRRSTYHIWESEKEGKFWKKIVNILPVGIAIFKEDSCIFRNKNIVNLFKTDIEISPNILQKVLQELRSTKSNLDFHNTSFHELLERNPICQKRYVHFDSQGQEVPLAISIFDLKKAGCTYSVLLAQDQEVIEELQQERIKREYQKKFLAMVTHELRNPLNGITGIFDLLQYSPQLPTTLVSYCNTGFNTSKYMMWLVNDITLLLRKRLVSYYGYNFPLTFQVAGSLYTTTNDILDMSQIEAGKFQLMIEPADFSSVARECTSIMEQQYAKKNIVLEFETDGDIGIRLSNDKRRYSQIVINLLSNALKFTPPGGRVAIYQSYDSEMQTLQTTVRDTGSGMDSETSNRLFGMYSTVRNRTNPEGIGLGLHICKKLTEQMGGSITAESKLGKGTAITFTILNHKPENEDPLILQIEKPIHKHRNTDEFLKLGTNEKKRIKLEDSYLDAVVIDDDFSTAFLIKAIFQGHSLHIESYESGMAGIEKVADLVVRGLFPKIIFIDMHLPDKNGLEVISDLHQVYEKAGKVQPLYIGVSGDSDPELARQCEDLGFAKLLAKPFSRAEIESIIKNS